MTLTTAQYEQTISAIRHRAPHAIGPIILTCQNPHDAYRLGWIARQLHHLNPNTDPTETILAIERVLDTIKPRTATTAPTPGPTPQPASNRPAERL